eukprot:scaffold46143_cov26-Tisochrysis_lutea.AAC.13
MQPRVDHRLCNIIAWGVLPGCARTCAGDRGRMAIRAMGIAHKEHQSGVPNIGPGARGCRKHSISLVTGVGGRGALAE